MVYIWQHEPPDEFDRCNVCWTHVYWIAKTPDILVLYANVNMYVVEQQTNLNCLTRYLEREGVNFSPDPDEGIELCVRVSQIQCNVIPNLLGLLYS